jgi:membrane protease YdiL (CAAX protease family)
MLINETEWPAMVAGRRLYGKCRIKSHGKSPLCERNPMSEQQPVSPGTTISSRESKPELIAPVWHTVELICILALIVAVELVVRLSPHHAGTVHAPRRPMSGLYISVILSEWFLVFGVWSGIRIHGNRLRDLIGGRWNTWRAVALDVVLALGFWVMMLSLVAGVSFATRSFLGGSDTHTRPRLLPQGLLETLLWVGLSLSAGFCEEFAFRGYFQKQFHAMTGSAVAAILMQALIFGLIHFYAGMFAAIGCAVLGVLYGFMAQRRKSLRPGMLAHVGFDLTHLTRFQ